MGASTYRPSYSGKGSTSSTKKTTRTTGSESPMLKMLRLLAKVESCREDVDNKQKDLDDAKRALEEAEQEVFNHINELDPETRARLREMMGESEKDVEPDQK